MREGFGKIEKLNKCLLEKLVPGHKFQRGFVWIDILIKRSTNAMIISSTYIFC